MNSVPALKFSLFPLFLLSLPESEEKNEKGDANEKRNTWVMCFRICFVYMVVLKLEVRFYRGRNGLWKHRGRNEVRELVVLEGIEEHDT